MSLHSERHAPVSLIVPTLNEEMSIARMLTSVLGGSLLPAEILLIDGGSKDETIAVAEKTSADAGVSLIVVENRKQRVQHALNLGLCIANYPYIMRLDGHCAINDVYIDVLYHHLEMGQYGGVGGVKLACGYSEQGRANAAAQNSILGVGNSAYHYQSEPGPASHIPFGFYPTALVRELGGWDPDLAVNQDYEFDYRLRQAGHQLFIDPTAKILWDTRDTLLGLYRQYRRYGRGKSQVARRHPGSIKARHAMPSLVLGAVSATVAFAPPKPSCRALALGALAYSASGIAASGRSDTGAQPVRTALALASMHAGYGLGMLEGLAGKDQLGSQVSGGADRSYDPGKRHRQSRR